VANLPVTSDPRSLPKAPAERGREALKIVAPEHLEVYRSLRNYPLFDGIPNEVLQEAIATGELSLQSFWRDEIISDGPTLQDQGPAVYLVRSGQVAVAIFPHEVLERERQDYMPLSIDEKKKKVRPHGPLIKLAQKNLATFGEGEIFNSESIPAADPERCAFYCVSPCELLVFSKQRIGEFTARFEFFAKRLRRAVEVARDRLKGISGIKQEILDFYVRHGLSVAETLRVRQIDRCIECMECEKACETRYGHKRLTLKGPRLGMLDFVFACRTCTDQRCLSPCNYDSIKFDAQKREVIINEATCTGCAACANACPYGSIEMVELDSPKEKLFKIRLEKDGSLKFGPEAGRKVAASKIASKCDHCASFGDQSCITHCPTGAIIEIKPGDLFQDRGEVARQAARTGFDQTVMLDNEGMLPADPYSKGLGITDGAAAKVKQRRINPAVLWGIGLGTFLLCLVEIVLRVWQPALSLQYASFRLAGLEPEIARLKVNFKPGCDFAVWLGYIGTGLMVVSLLFPLWKRSRLMQRIGSSAAWFDWHLVGGTIGPLYIILHAAMKLDNWVSVAYWAMIMIVLSGIMGRYLRTQVPEMLHGREMEELEHERAMAKLRSLMPQAVAAADRDLMAFRQAAMRVASKSGFLYAFLWTIVDDLKRPLRWARRKIAIMRSGASRKTRRELEKHAGMLMLLERRRILVPRTQGVLHHWKQVHVWFTFVMSAVSIIHIVVALTYSM
jgi:Fe-S-cluster-containing hydrogenase component 2